MVTVNCPRVTAVCPCSLTEDEVVPLFDEHYEVPSPPGAFYQVYIPVEDDEKKALVRFGPDGYKLHTSLDALHQLNDYVNFELADNDVIEPCASDMRILWLDVRISPPLDHDVFEYFDKVGMGGRNDEDPQYEIAGYTVTIHDDPFRIGTVHLGPNGTIDEAREALDDIQTALAIASG